MKISIIAIAAIQLPILTFAATVKNLVIFGDSNSDVGNGQRWSNGPLWNEYLTAAWNASLYNFAYSGSVCDSNMYNSIAKEDRVPSLKDQMEAYYNLKLDLKPEETVYGFWFGVQDIYEMSKRHGKQEPDYKEITDCIGQQLRIARKSFLSDRFIVLNIAPLGHMPYYQGSNVAMNRSQASVEINRGLEKDIANLNKHHHALEMDYLDIHSLLNDIVIDPTTFGFKNSSAPYLDSCDNRPECKGQVKDYIWWDKTHFTTSFHKLIATSIIEAESYMPKIEMTSTLEDQLKNSKSKFRSKKYTVKTSNNGVLEEVARLYDVAKSVPAQPSQPPLEEDELEYEMETINHNNTFAGLFIILLLIGIVACIKFPSLRFHHGRGKFIPVRNEEL
ncbi:hypothetical protein BDF21DRAFT_392998 [Thamnidium elegans]|nr:hypothetical protein BDF21DRAFT_392998 [Thamnidium elegans]